MTRYGTLRELTYEILSLLFSLTRPIFLLNKTVFPLSSLISPCLNDRGPEAPGSLRVCNLLMFTCGVRINNTILPEFVGNHLFFTLK